MNSRLWLASAPRIRTWANDPAGPLLATEVDGNSRKYDVTAGSPSRSRRSSSMMLTLAALFSGVVGTRDAVITIAGSSC